jgi:uracil-DNA glycosylase
MKHPDIDKRIKLIGTKRPKACPTECPLHPDSPLHNPMLSGGHVPPKIVTGSRLLVIGIAPAEEEELAREPLVGPSGRYAGHALQWAAGSRPLKYSKVNLVNCRTVKPGRTRSFINRTPPTTLELRYCYHAIVRPILKRPWKCIALFGGDVYKFMIPEINLGHGKSMKMFDVFGKAMGHRCQFDPEKFLSWYDDTYDIPF